MSRKRKPQAPSVSPEVKSTDAVITAMHSMEIPSLEVEDKVTSSYGSQGEIVKSIEEVFEKNPLTPLPITGDAGLEMFDETFKKAVKDKYPEIIVVPEGLSPGATEKFNDIHNSHDLEQYEDIKIVPVIQDYSTLLEFYQARNTVRDADLDFIPFDYIDMDFETNILKSINFAFMIPFDVIKNGVNYCTVKSSDFIINENVSGIPSKYDLIDNGTTVHVHFNINGKYDVKSMFDSTFTVLQSSLLSNHKIAK